MKVLLLIAGLVAYVSSTSHTYNQVGRRGIIQSENYPSSNYPSNEKLRWIITATHSADAVIFTFQAPFSLGKGDFVQVVDYDASVNADVCSSSLKPLYKFTGHKVPEDTTWYEKGNTKPARVIVEFCSNRRKNDKGFKLTWHAAQLQVQTTTLSPSVTTAAPGPTSEPSNDTTTCGVQAKGYEPEGLNDESKFIVGGNTAKPHSWPWTVALMMHMWGSWLVDCGGTLVDNQFVVTAGHCFYHQSPSEVSSFVVKIGVHDRGSGSTTNEEGQVIRRIAKAIVHPEYSAHRTSHDVTVLKLDRPVEYSDTVRPACLPTDKDQLPGGTKVVVTGWGDTTEGGSEPEKLHQVQVPIVDQKLCNTNYHGEIDETMICAGLEQTGGEDSCQGDSGGPLQQKRNGKWVLEGIVSWGYGCAEPKKPGVYARVAALVDWINETIRKEKDAL